MSPAQLGAQRDEGRVVLDFYIDERGRTRMPVVAMVVCWLDWRPNPSADVSPESPPPDELQKFLATEIDRWGGIIERAGVAKSQ